VPTVVELSDPYANFLLPPAPPETATAGAGAVGAVVIGRHVREEFGSNAARLKALPRFCWEQCALE